MKWSQSITTLLWDQDNTLMDFSYSQRQALIRSFQHFGREIGEEVIGCYEQINNDYWSRFELGRVTREELKTGRFKALFVEIGAHELDAEDFFREYQEALGSIYSYLDDSLTICKSFQGRLRQYIVTNGLTYTQRKKITLSGFVDVMEGIFISEEIGKQKPDREFFDRCLSGVEETDRDRIMIVGDSISSDIKGGIQAGIRTCWYNPGGAVNNTVWQADYEISDLHQLYDILELPDALSD